MEGAVDLQVNYAWQEWYPGPAFGVPHMTLLTGDEMLVSVWYDGTEARYLMANRSRGFSTAGRLDSGQFLPVDGSTAEWIIERPRRTGGWDPLESTCRHASLSIL